MFVNENQQRQAAGRLSAWVGRFANVRCGCFDRRFNP